MTANLLAVPAEALYDGDFIAWTEEMARLIENRQTDGLDRENLAEEIRDLGRCEQNAVCSHLENLLMHLIKWEIQPGHRTNSWKNSIMESRQRWSTDQVLSRGFLPDQVRDTRISSE